MKSLVTRYVVVLMTLLLVESTIGWSSSFVASNEVTKIAIQGKYTWVGTHSGLIRLDTSTDSIRVFDTSDGLLGINVTGLAVAPDGIVWVSTVNGGISRFDGASWQSYDQDDGIPKGGSLSSYRRFAFAQDGTVWAAGNGVVCFDGTRWKSFDSTNGLTGYMYCVVAIDKNDIPWVGATYEVNNVSVANLYYYENNCWHEVVLPEIDKNFHAVDNILFDKDGCMYVDMMGPAFFRIDGFNVELWHPVAITDSIYSLNPQYSITGPDGRFWFLTWSLGAFWFDGTEWGRVPDSPLTSQEQSIAVDDSGHVWVGTWLGEGGFACYNGESWRLYRFTDRLADDDVRSVTVGHDGSLWAATPHGISRYNKGYWQTYTTADSLPDNDIYSLYTSHDGKIWAAGHYDVAVYDGTHWMPLHINEIVKPYIITKMAIDLQNNLWIGAYLSSSEPYDFNDYGRIIKYDGESWDITEVKYDIRGNGIQDIAIAPNGDVWIPTRHTVFHVVGNVWETFTPEDFITELDEYGFHSIAIGSDNRVYLNVYPAGVYCYENQQWHMLDDPEKSSSRPGDTIWNVPVGEIAVSDDNTLWLSKVGPSKTIYSMKSGVNKKYTADFLSLRSIAFGESIVYFGTDRGIYYFSEFEAPMKPITLVEEVTGIKENSVQEEFVTSAVFPNPFNPTTTITFTLPRNGLVTVSVYNITGQKVATLVDNTMSAGAHSVVFDGAGLASGVYFFRVTCGGATRTGKMLLMK
jgi:hypothetical protein